MKRLFSKILSLLLAFVLLFSTVSISVAKHYCGDILVDVAVFKEASSCGMEMKNNIPRDCAVTKKNCCKDIQLVIEGQDNLKDTASINLLSSFEVFVWVRFIYSGLNYFEDVADKDDIFKEYIPPLLVRDIQLLDQTFLI